MDSPMLRDIVRQPAVVAALLARRAAFQGLCTPDPGGRVWVCGCGDGLFAAHAAGRTTRNAGLDWRSIGALDLVLGADGLRPADRVIAISMSGNVDRTVEAAQAASARVPVLALVNGGGGRLGAVARRLVSIELPDAGPFLCGTSSYTATLAALMLMAGGNLEPAQAAMTAVVSAPLPAVPVPRGGVRILAAGPESGTAQYAAAKLVELTRIPVWHADLEEFAHSQYWSMPQDSLLIVIATDPAVAQYADNTCAALQELGVPTLAIHTPTAPVPAASMRITLPDIPAALAPLLSAVPLQRLAYGWARDAGLDPDTRQHLKDDAVRFRVSRLLTRRSLIGTGQ